MIGKTALIVVASSFFSVGALQLGAEDTTARARLIGAWQPKDLAVKDAGIWTLERKAADVIHITYVVGDEKTIELECETTGKDCKMKDSGKTATVSMWFSGPNLVSLETRGDAVVKRRFGVEDGGWLQVEIIPIQPNGKTEKAEFRRIRP